MPRLELGDLKTVAAYKEYNIPQLLAAIDCRASTSSRRFPPAC